MAEVKAEVKAAEPKVAPAKETKKKGAKAQEGAE